MGCAAYREYLTQGARVASGKHETVDQIVDVGEMIKRASTPDQHEPTALNGFEQLQEPKISGSIDPRWTHDDARQTGFEVLTRNQLAFKLRLLVVVSGLRAVFLVCRRMIDPTLHAHRRAMNKPPHASLLRGFSKVSGRVHIDSRELGTVGRLGPIQRSDVKHSIEWLESTQYLLGIGNVDFAAVDALLPERLGACHRAHECRNLRAFVDQPVRESAARESGRACQ